ncbi:MAG: glycosyltransferase [Hyphomicrobiales bacterium]|nr:glycosyltransferase [Hyphomicrobiales bacterium]MDE2018302.1 glycosyltransferase [Hyphomicrobiales bacterium]
MAGSAADEADEPPTIGGRPLVGRPTFLESLAAVEARRVAPAAVPALPAADETSIIPSPPDAHDVVEPEAAEPAPVAPPVIEIHAEPAPPPATEFVPYERVAEPLDAPTPEPQVDPTLSAPSPPASVEAEVADENSVVSPPKAEAENAEAANDRSPNLAQLVRAGGARAALAALADAGLPDEDAAAALTEAAVGLRNDDPTSALTLIDEALVLAPTPARQRERSFILFSSGSLRDAARALHDAVAAGAGMPAADREVAARLRAEAHLFAYPVKLPPASARATPQTEHALILGARPGLYAADPELLRLRARVDLANKAGWTATARVLPALDAAHAVESPDPSAPALPYAAARFVNRALDARIEELAREIVRATEAAGASVIQASGSGPAAMAAAIAARRVNLPLVYDAAAFYDPTRGYLPGQEKSDRFRLDLSGALFAARAADACLAHGVLIAEALRRSGVDAERIVELGDCLPTVGSPPPEFSAEAAESLGLSKGSVAGFVGPASSDFDWEALAKAFGAIRTARPDVKFLFAGAGAGANAFHRAASGLGLAEAVVYVDAFGAEDRATLFGLVDAALFPRFGGSAASLATTPELLDALAHGSAVVTSRTYATLEWMERGRTCLLVEPGDWQGLATAALDLLGDEEARTKLSLAAKASVETRCDTGKLAGDLRKVYERVSKR